MGHTLKKNFSPTDKIQQGEVINAHHVSQSVDAFTGAKEYDITVKGKVQIEDLSGTIPIPPTYIFDGNNLPDFTGVVGDDGVYRWLSVNSNKVVGYLLPGAEGPAGEQGPVGEQGPPGEQGTSGDNGTSGTSGTSGEQGDPQTPIGENGTNGTSGVGGVGKTFTLIGRRNSGAPFPNNVYPGGYFFRTFNVTSQRDQIYIPTIGGNNYQVADMSSNPFPDPDTDDTLYSNLNTFNIGHLINELQSRVNDPSYLDDIILTIHSYYDSRKLIGIVEDLELLGFPVYGPDVSAGILNFQDFMRITLRNLSGGGAQLYMGRDVGDPSSEPPPIPYSFTFSSVSKLQAGNRSGTSGTSPSAILDEIAPIEEFDNLEFFIQQNLNSSYKTEIPSQGEDVSLGKVSFAGTNSNLIESQDVDNFYINNKDSNGNLKNEIFSERLTHFQDGVLRLKTTSTNETDFSFENLTTSSNYVQISNVSADTNGKSFIDDKTLRKFEVRNSTWVYELEPNEYKRIYVEDKNSYGNSKICLVGLKEGVSGYFSTGKFVPGVRTSVEIKAGDKPIDLQYLALTGTAINNGNQNPYSTKNPTRTRLGILNAEKTAIVDFIYYESNDGSRYGLIPTGVKLNID